MALSRSEVQNVGLLARLRLSDQELEALTPQLSQIVDYVEMLNELDTEDIEPMAHPLAVHNVFRSDDPVGSMDRAEVLRNAPKQADGFYCVPPVLE